MMYQKNYFNFKRIKNKYLLTNDFGNYIFLNSSEFEHLKNNEKLPLKISKELENKQFIYFESKQEFVKYHYQKLQEYKGENAQNK